MKTKEQIIKEKGLSKLLNEFGFWHEVEEAMEEYAKQFKYDYSKDCKCGNERIGETWCCNQCGLPVSK